MHKRSIPFLISCLLLLLLGCNNPKTDQSVTQDSLESVSANNTDSQFEQPGTSNDSTTQALLLKWVEINMSEYGPAYVFEDKAGNQVFIQFIEMPGFDFQKNDYFEAVYSDDSMFPTITLRKEVIGQWYRATIKNELRELVGATGEVSIVTGLEPVIE